MISLRVWGASSTPMDKYTKESGKTESMEVLASTYGRINPSIWEDS